MSSCSRRVRERFLYQGGFGASYSGEWQGGRIFTKIPRFFFPCLMTEPTGLYITLITIRRHSPNLPGRVLTRPWGGRRSLQIVLYDNTIAEVQPRRKTRRYLLFYLCTLSLDATNTLRLVFLLGGYHRPIVFCNKRFVRFWFGSVGSSSVQLGFRGRAACVSTGALQDTTFDAFFAG